MRVSLSTAHFVVTIALLSGCLRAVAVEDTGPRMGAAAFFTSLDLARPELSAVSNAVAKADYAAATKAFAQHLRTRALPTWDVDPAAFGHKSTYRNGAADDALKHKMTAIGIPWQFEGEVDWAFNPTTAPGSKWPANREWTWQLNRHDAWRALAETFYWTGDEKYAAEFAMQVRHWVKNCPVPLKVNNGAGSRWRTIECGIRTGSAWPAIWPRILRAKSVDDATLVLWVMSWTEHAPYLMKYPSHGNWLTMEANGLYHIGALFPEFRDAKTWRETALARLEAEFDIQVYPDGAQMELAPGYHGVSLYNLLGPVSIAEETGFAVPPTYLAKAERMFDYFLYSMQPTRRTPPLNDSGAGDVLRDMERGAQLFPGRADFRWFATRGKTGAPPAQASHFFPYAGQAIFRSGWDRDAAWVCFEGGPFGMGHQHEDKLGLQLTAFGKPLLVEGGVYTYDASVWRQYVLGSRAHNVVLVDDLEQARKKSPRETWTPKTPAPMIWQTNDTYDLSQSVFDEGWGTGAVKIARHTRTVVHIKPDLFIAADRIESLDGMPHRSDALFHFDATGVQVDGLTVTTTNAGPNLAIRAFGADSVAIVTGQTNPVVQGWLPDGSLGYGGIRPIPTAVFTKQSATDARMVFVLAPARDAASCPVAEAAFDEKSLRLKLTNGTERMIALPAS